MKSSDSTYVLELENDGSYIYHNRYHALVDMLKDWYENIAKSDIERASRDLEDLAKSLPDYEDRINRIKNIIGYVITDIESGFEGYIDDVAYIVEAEVID